MSDNLNLRRGRRLTDDEWLRAQDERWRAELREILRRPAPWEKGEYWGARVGVFSP